MAQEEGAGQAALNAENPFSTTKKQAPGQVLKT